jgi:archaellum biogenesis ATPase FlaH
MSESKFTNNSQELQGISSVNKDEILKHDKQIFEYHIPEWREGKNFLSPLREETSPSAGVYKNGNGQYYYKDHGNGDHLSPIDFVMKKHNLTFPEALKQINQDLGLADNSKSKASNISYRSELKECELNYLKQYGIEPEACKKYNVVSIDKYTIESGRQYIIKSSPTDFILAYKVAENTFKTYRPLNNKFKFSWLGVKPVNYVFGYSELPEKFKYVFITGGEKDVLTLASHRYPAICFNSESAIPTPELIQDLKTRFENVIVLYDLDKTGKDQSEKLKIKFGLKSMSLPEELFTKGIGKDVSDYFKASYQPEHKDTFNTEAFDIILNEVLTTEVSPKLEAESKTLENVFTHSFYDLWNKRNDEAKLLIPDLMPAAGILMLLGEDGIGKTQLVRQLSLNIAFGIPEFLGQPLNITHGRVMFISTEDSSQDYIKAGKKQVYGLGQNENVKPELPIDFVEATNFDSYDDLLSEVDRLLELKHYDLIVVDAFSDLFTLVNGEINSNTHARQLLNPIQARANKHQTLFIILHHASKSAMKNKRERGQILVEKNDCQGASAITQKPRTVLALSNDPKEGINYLHCVKANGLPKKFKETALKMSFNEETLLHELLDYSPVFETESPKDKAGLMPSEIAKEMHDGIIKEVFKKEPYQGYARLKSNIQLVYSANYKQIGLNKAVEFITYYKMNGMINQEPGNKGRYYVSV